MTPNPQDSAVALEVERAIREALDAGPTRGPWRASYDGHGGMRIESLEWQIGYASKAGGKQEANAALIAACNPEAMRSLLAEIDRLRASQSDGTLGGWRPIASAPKDGTEILLSNGEAVQQGWWMENEGGVSEYRDTDGRYLGQHEDDGFIGWWDVGGCMQPSPTHW